MKKLILILAFLFLAVGARAQTQTNVTATVVDPNGIPYSNGTYSIQLIPTGNNPSVNGQAIGGAFNGSTDVNGRFNVSLWPNANITPAGTHWQVTVCESPGIQPPLGTGPQCSTPPLVVTIAGATQNLSAALSAVAPSLTNFAGGAGLISGTCAPNGILYGTGAHTIACGPFTYNPVNGTVTNPTDDGGTGTAAALHLGSPCSALNTFFTSNICPGPNGNLESYQVGNGTAAGGSSIFVVNQNAYAAGFTIYSWQDGTHTQMLSNDGANFVPIDDGLTTSAAVTGVFSLPVAQNASNITGDDVGEIGAVRGFDSEPSVDTGSHADFLIGYQAKPITQDALSTVTNMMGFRSIPNPNLAGAAVTNVYGYRADSINGAGTVTNAYGFYSQDVGGSSPGSTINAAFFAAPQVAGANNFGFHSDATNKDVFGLLTAKTYSTATHCSSAASPAVCGSAAAGFAVIAAGASSVTIDTTAVTANSSVLIEDDESLGIALGVTCNMSLGAHTLIISARTPGTSFAVFSSVTPTVNPDCFSYSIVN